MRIGKREVPVGAFADFGDPNFVDVLVPDHLAESLGVRGRNELIVGAGSGVTLETLGKDLRAAAGKGAARVVRLAALPAGGSRTSPAKGENIW